MRLILSKAVLHRIRTVGGALAETELDLFIEAKANGTRPRRLDKPCGYHADRRLCCQLHVDLGLWHYRLTEHVDPILLYQMFGGTPASPDVLKAVAVVRHEHIFYGNDEKWCHENHRLLDWDGNEANLEALEQKFGPLP